MSRIRYSHGRFIKTREVIEIPTNYHRGRNSPTTNSPERYRNMPIGSSSTLKPKDYFLEYITRKP